MTLPLFLALLVFEVVLGFQVHSGRISGADIAAWPYSVCILDVGLLPSLVPCIGLIGSDDIGHFGSFLYWSFLFFLSDGLDTDCSVKR